MLCGVKTEIAVLAFLATCVISCIAQEPVVSITGPKLIRSGRPALGESYSKVFTVREFVRPTLSLEVKNPEIVGHSESSFPIKITASYTFGGPAAGNAEVKISYRYINAKAYQTSVYVPSNGVTIEVDTKNIPKSIGTTYAKVDVTFTDEVSKKVATSRSEFRFTEFLYKFVFVGDKYFIPNVTSENTIVLQKFDGTPAPEGTVIRIDIKKYCRRNSQNKNCIPALISSSRYELNLASSVSIEYTPKDADNFEIIAVSPLSRDRTKILRAEAFNPRRKLNTKLNVTISEDYSPSPIELYKWNDRNNIVTFRK